MTPRRIGAYRGVWRLVDRRLGAVSVEFWFDWRRAERAAQRLRQTSLDL